MLFGLTSLLGPTHYIDNLFVDPRMVSLAEILNTNMC